MVTLNEIAKLDDTKAYGDEIAKLIPSGSDLLSNEYNSPGKILREIKRIQSINEDDLDFPGLDALGGVNVAIDAFRKDKKAALEALGKKYEQFTQQGPQDRFDLPPLKDGLLGIKAAGSEQGQAQAKVMRDIKDAKMKDDAKEEPYDGPFGKFGKYLRDNEDKRSDFFNYIAAIGQRLVEPTKPGEARSLVSDISQGLTRGKASIAAQDAAALDALVKRSEAAANIDPVQNYSSKMKEIRKEAIELGYEPGTKEYSDYVGAALRGARVSAELEPLLDSLKIAKERQMIDPDDKGNNEIIKNLENKILALQSGTGGSVELGSSNDVPYLGGNLTTK